MRLITITLEDPAKGKKVGISMKFDKDTPEEKLRSDLTWCFRSVVYTINQTYDRNLDLSDLSP